MFHAIDKQHTWLLWLAISAATLAWVGLLYLMSRFLPSSAKKRVIITTTFLGGLFYVLEFFLPAESHTIFFWTKDGKNVLTPLIDSLGTASLAIGGFTFMLGVINLILVHGQNIRRLRAGWYNSAAFFLALVAMIFFGLWEAYGSHATSFGQAAHWTYRALFDGAYTSLAGTMFSLLAFYMAAAAFRAFRLRSGEASVLVIAAFLVMLGQVPAGMAMTSHLPVTGLWANLRVENIAFWILQVISMAGLRAVGFGVGVGALAMSLRLWLNLERGIFFEQEF
jgi:hypothetical protein